MLLDTLAQLKSYCEQRDFKGHDVGDSVECFLMRNTILGRSKLLRFCFTSLTGHRVGFVNLRPLMNIPIFHNGKGIALFLNAYCNFYDVVSQSKDQSFSLSLGTKEQLLHKIEYLGDLLVSLRHKALNGYGWGYPTRWQAALFWFPADTPTAVASSFAVDALLHAYQITGKDEYLRVAAETTTFVLEDLHRTKHNNGFFFSYSQYKGNDTVYNASLLAARILLQVYHFTKDEQLLSIAREAIDTVVNDQAADGSWCYGLQAHQIWIDNFHTGYNLEAIWEYGRVTSDDRYKESLERGCCFMMENMFDNHGVPKYFHNLQYPIDIHCCGALYPVLYKLGRADEYRKLSDDVFRWTVNNMFDKKRGYFYFQRHRFFCNKAPLMRWSQAFMMNALSYYLKSLTVGHLQQNEISFDA